MRRQSSTEVGYRQQRTEAVGHRYAGHIDPVGRAHRTAKLQLVSLVGYGRNFENDVRTRQLDSGNLVDGIGRRVKGNGQFDYSAGVVRPTSTGRPVEIAITALR